MKDYKTHIVIITGQHMVANPRVWKEANTFAENGYKVTILTTFYDVFKKELDKELLNSSIQYKASINLIKGEGTFVHIFFARIFRRLALFLKKIFNYDSYSLLLYKPKKQIRIVLAEKADLYIAHQEAGLAIGKELILRGKKVAFDFEDWYSNDYIIPERPIALLKSLEKFAIENALYVSCPSFVMANTLEKTYSSTNKIHVIYNGFSAKENVDEIKTTNKIPSLVWFSQTIGPGRGLETIIEAIAFLKIKIELHLIGQCVKGYDLELKRIFPFDKEHKLIFHEPVKHHELITILSKYNIGLAIENIFPESRNQTVTNKILQYLQSGLKVLATDTEGQKEVANYFPDSVISVPIKEPEIWAKEIEYLINTTEINLQKQLEQFNNIFSWEAQEKKLLTLIESIINLN